MYVSSMPVTRLQALLSRSPVAGALIALLVSGPADARADTFPARPLTMVVPFSAGGPTDTVTRLVAQGMSRSLGQQIVVENVAGAGGTIGAGRVARASADGYTLLLHHIGMATAPALYRKLTYKVPDDFQPIGLVADVPMTLVARKDFPAQDLAQLIAHLRQNRDKVTYANAGLGSASHLCGLLLMSAIQTDLTTVPYRGTGPAMNDLLGKQVDFMCDQTTNTTSQIKAGKVKAYGVTTRSRVPSLPDLRPLHESGLPNFEVVIWHALYAPRGTPAPVVDRLVRALREALQDRNIAARLRELGSEPATRERAAPEPLRALLKSELDRWGGIIRKAGVYAD
jgi:tripartite-type tricarboxylate transporter receptor subunit TctC